MNLKYGKIQIHLNDNLSYKWTTSDAGCVRGYAYVGEKYLEGNALLDYLQRAETQEEILKRIIQLNGLYSFIINTPFGVLACVDQVRSMPLFYKIENEIVIYDNLDEDAIAGAKIDGDALGVFRNCVFTPNDKTLFQNFFQVQTGCYLLISEAGIRQYQHFKIRYEDQQITNMDKAVRLLDKSMTETVGRTISILNGRTAVVPLSGGHDSRILIFYFKKLGYQKIIAYSYGLPGNEESVCSQKVAEILGIPWHFVCYDAKEMRELYQKDFRAYAALAANGTSIPHMQDWYAVYKLKQQSILPEDSVFLPGYAGDFTAGKYIWRDTDEAEPIECEKLITFITKYEFVPDYIMGRQIMCSESEQAAIRKALQEEFPQLLKKNYVFSAKEANQIIEQAIASGWNSKFIANAVRVYDFFGYPWLMPFFERSQFKNWFKIDNSLRRFEFAYFEQARRIYPDELNKVNFASGRDLFALKERLLEENPNFTHYLFGYFSLGDEFYKEISQGVAKGPNVYLQNYYLEILGKICTWE